MGVGWCCDELMSKQRASCSSGLGVTEMCSYRCEQECEQTKNVRSADAIYPQQFADHDSLASTSTNTNEVRRIYLECPSFPEADELQNVF